MQIILLRNIALARIWTWNSGLNIFFKSMPNQINSISITKKIYVSLVAMYKLNLLIAATTKFYLF